MSARGRPGGGGRPRSRSRTRGCMIMLAVSIVAVAMCQLMIVHEFVHVTSPGTSDDLGARASDRGPPPGDKPPKDRDFDEARGFTGQRSDERRSNERARERAKAKGAVVYLAQFGNHSSYGVQRDPRTGTLVTGHSKLNRSLALLYANYADRFPADVLVFHDGGSVLDDETISELSRGREGLKFVSLRGKRWSLPHGLKAWHFRAFRWKRPAFGVGYRLMVRWYAVSIWDYLRGEGYTHVLRLDDDSYVLSEIEYDLFDYARENGIKYGFRMPVYEEGGEEFDSLIDRYLAEHPNVTTPESIEAYQKDRGVGFYNNFFLADVSFFTTPPASDLLRVIDESKLIFTHRTGDLVIQSALVRLFARPEEVHWFRDFNYEHMTLCRKDKCGPLVRKGCPQNGGLARGAGLYTDAEWRDYARREVKDRFKDNPRICNIPVNDEVVGANDVRDCVKPDSRCGAYLSRVSGGHGTTIVAAASAGNETA
ncbi:hypothetical protein ACHAWF_018817 [Thalassiosira exigua]